VPPVGRGEVMVRPVGPGGAAWAEPDESKLRPKTLRLKRRLSAKRWTVVVKRAWERVEILEETARRHAEIGSWRKALEDVASEVPWPTWLHWRQCSVEREGEAWEKQLDARAPPEPYRLSGEVRLAACMLRRANPTMDYEEAQKHLKAQFGEEPGKVSPTSLKRIWKAAGLAQPWGRRRKVPEVEEEFSGGGGLALVLAAAAETKAVTGLATTVLEQAQLAGLASEQEGEKVEVEGRDENGQFTATYNREMVGAGLKDPRWGTEEEKRKGRRLGELTVAHSSVEVVERKLLAMGMTPLLTERRGFDGLCGPHGAWLGILGPVAYQAATLDKTLGELGALDVGEALWQKHGQQWVEVTKGWWEEPGKPHWLRWIIYVDATQEPYWTRSFALSGKVSRVGKVMPCLTDVAVMGGAGVPLYVVTRAGTVSLKKELLPTLERVERVVGKGELGRLTVVDAEMGTLPLLRVMSTWQGRWFIVVVKGGLETSAERIEVGEWQEFRERDRVRDVKVQFITEDEEEDGKKKKGVLVLRGVEMEREGSRHPTTTLMVTNAPQEVLSTTEVPTAYLSRWPHQEQRFRNGRNGLGLERTVGYGGQLVTNVALQTAQEKVAGQEKHAEKKLAAAQEREQRARLLLEGAGKEQQSAAKENLRHAERDGREAHQRLEEVKKDKERLATMPREIYARDPTRDNIMTCLKMTMLMLLEFVLKEYFGGLRMEIRTFIEELLALPVTVCRSKQQVIYRIQGNPRSPELTERLRVACQEVTRRRIQAGGRRLRLEVAGPAPGPSG